MEQHFTNMRFFVVFSRIAVLNIPGLASLLGIKRHMLNQSFDGKNTDEHSIWKDGKYNLKKIVTIWNHSWHTHSISVVEQGIFKNQIFIIQDFEKQILILKSQAGIYNE